MVLDNSNLVRVTVTGPQSIVKSELRRNDIVAEADMSKLTDINTIAITYYCENISNDSVEIRGNHDSRAPECGRQGQQMDQTGEHHAGRGGIRLYDRQCNVGSDQHRSNRT